MQNPVEDFLQMSKQAGFLDNLKSALSGLGEAFKGGLGQKVLERGTELTMGQALARGAGQALLPAAVTAGAAGIATGTSVGIGAIRDRFSKARDYKAMMQAHPSLSDKDPGQTQLYFNSLRRMAPTLSKDPLVAGSFVRNMMDLQPEAGPAVPIATAKTLTEAQKAIIQAKERRPIADAFMTGRIPLHEMGREQQQLLREDRYGWVPGEKLFDPITGKQIEETPPTWGQVGHVSRQYGAPK